MVGGNRNSRAPAIHSSNICKYHTSMDLNCLTLFLAGINTSCSCTNSICGTRDAIWRVLINSFKYLCHLDIAVHLKIAVGRSRAQSNSFSVGDGNQIRFVILYLHIRFRMLKVRAPDSQCGSNPTYTDMYGCLLTLLLVLQPPPSSLFSLPKVIFYLRMNKN